MSLLRDARTFTRAAITNQLARFAPSAYVRLTGQTGRGAEPESPEDIADYFERCFADYRARLQRVGITLDDLLQGNDVAEYGPGDLPGVALLMYAHGARHVTCVDRFPLVNVTEKNRRVLAVLLERMTPQARERAATAFNTPGEPGSGLRAAAIEYQVTTDGRLGARDRYALVYSRAVLEHVNNLPGTFADMRVALRPEGVAMHQVDLKSHGLHRETPLDFLCWPPWMWSVMHSNKGFPNRWRIDAYRKAIAAEGFEQLMLEPVETADAPEVAAVRGRLPRVFADLSDGDLAWLSFWMILRRG